MDKVAIPALVSDKAVAFFGTISKDTKAVQNQLMYQPNIKNPKFYEVITFENTPCAFFSIAILPPQVCLTFANVDSVTFKSETHQDALDSCEYFIFARMVYANGQRRYRKCSLVDIPQCSWRLFVLEEPEPIVDCIMIVGNMSCISFVIFKRDGGLGLINGELILACDAPQDAIYYGNNILDFEINDISTSTSYLAADVVPQTPEIDDDINIGILDPSSQAASSLLQLVDELVIDLKRSETLEIIEANIEALTNSQDVVPSQIDDILQALESLYWHSEFMFDSAISTDGLLKLTKICCEKLTFTSDDLHFKLLHSLLRDEKLAMSCMGSDVNLPGIIVSKFTTRRLFHQQVALDLLNDILVHYKCIEKFTEGKKSLYHQFSAAIENDRVHEIFNAQLRDIESKLELYTALKEATRLFYKLKNCDVHSISIDMPTAFLNSLLTVAGLIEEYEKSVKDSNTIPGYPVSYLVSVNVSELLLELVHHLKVQPYAFAFAFKNYLGIFEHIINLMLTMELAIDPSAIAREFMALLDPMKRLIHVDLNLAHGMFAEICSKVAAIGGRAKKARLVSLIIRGTNIEAGINHLYCTCSGTNANGDLESLVMILSLPQLFPALLDTLEKQCICRYDVPILAYRLGLVLLWCLERDYSGSLLFNHGQRLWSILQHVTNVNENGHRHELENCRELSKLQENEMLHALGEIFNHQDELSIDFKTLLDTCNSIADPFGLKPSLSTLNCNGLMGVNLQGKYLTSFMKHYRLEGATKHFCSKQISQSYSTSDNINQVLELYWGSNAGDLDRYKTNGFDMLQAQIYSKCRLNVLAPKRMPRFLHAQLRMLCHMVTLEENIESVHAFALGIAPMDSIIALWSHVLANICPDLDTVLYAPLGSFSSVLGYKWLQGAQDSLEYICTLSNLVCGILEAITKSDCGNIVYNRAGAFAKAIRFRFTGDTFEYSCGGDLITIPLGYFNDVVLRLVILTAAQLGHFENCTQPGSAAFKCLVACGHLVYFWYHRFEKSRRYLMNELMKAYTSLPKMGLGIGYLIVAAKPRNFCNFVLQVHALGSERGDAKHVYFHDGYYEYWTESMETDDLQPRNVLFVPLLVDFMCTLANRCVGSNASNLVFIANMTYYMQLNGLQMDVFIKAVASGVLSGNPKGLLRMCYFYRCLVSLYHGDPQAQVRQRFCILLDVMEFYARVQSLAESQEYQQTQLEHILLDGYKEAMGLLNSMWRKSASIIASYTEFTDLVAFVSSALCYICKLIYNRVDAGIDNRVDITIVAGLETLCLAFQIPLVCLLCLYTLPQASLETITRCIGHECESEHLQVAPNFGICLSQVIEHLCNRVMTTNVTIGLVGLELIQELCELIHYTGEYQDCFLYNLVHATMVKDIKVTDSLFRHVLEMLQDAITGFNIPSNEADSNLLLRMLLLQNSFQYLDANVAPRDVPKSIPLSLFLKEAAAPSCYNRSTSLDLLNQIAHCQSHVPPAQDDFEEYIREFSTFDFDCSIASISNRQLQVDGKVFDRLHIPKTVTMRIEKLDNTDQVRYRKSSSSRAPSKHVDEFDYEKAAASYATIKGWSKETIQKLAANITCKHWHDFDTELSTKGLNLKSLVTNPMQLKDPLARSSLCEAVAHHAEISELLINCGFSLG
ncbi:hypothetical protein BdWA1_001921 [Babesia duncani]|uniref:Uncharacterized protein n=1 Tax=Babesia duncani TaxID=323732 RepID=A0AAD9PKT0_9APIC|nr:hypothetical protein BdWA1_001921 [Babesia duncani]